MNLGGRDVQRPINIAAQGNPGIQMHARFSGQRDHGLVCRHEESELTSTIRRDHLRDRVNFPEVVIEYRRASLRSQDIGDRRHGNHFRMVCSRHISVGCLGQRRDRELRGHRTREDSKKREEGKGQHDDWSGSTPQ